LSFAFPTVFLSIAAFMSSAVLTRLVRLQREQIAQLKALGYSSRQIGAHYFKFALVMVVGAVSVGSLAGSLLGRGFVEVFKQFFRFPQFDFQPDWPVMGLALFVSAGAAFVGVFGSVRMAVTLPPAEAMRPEPPARFTRSWLERVGLYRLASPTIRMALRNLQRRPWQAFFTMVGLALATAIPIVPGAMREGIDYILTFQWSLAARQDATVSLVEPGSASVLNDLRHLPGVMNAEPFRSAPARLRYGHHSRRLSVTGLPRGATLNRLLDANAVPVQLPPDGLLLSAKLAETLGAKPGDRVIIEVQEGRRPTLDAVIHGTISDYAGIAAYMEIDALRRLLREGGTISGAHLSVDSAQWPAFLQRVEESPRVAGLGITAAVQKTFQKTTGEMIGKIQWLYFIFATIVAFGVVYNSARISLSERNRDLATLRVVGFSKREVAGVMISELVVLTILAVPFGLWIGKQLATAIVTSVSTETVRLPLVLTSSSYGTAVLIVLLASAVSFAVVTRRIHKLDLLGVLKARD
jgi:putative ABC transport system permease protein